MSEHHVSVKFNGKPIKLNNNRCIFKTATVHIGQNEYPYKQIGNLLWTTVSLHEPLGEFKQDYCYSSNGELDNGYLYKLSSLLVAQNQYTDAFAQLIPNGWRMPTCADYSDLISNSNNPLDYISTSKGGLDTFGFNAELLGYKEFISDASVGGYGRQTFLAAADNLNHGMYYRFELYINKITYNEYIYNRNCHEIRLCKDA